MGLSHELPVLGLVLGGVGGKNGSFWPLANRQSSLGTVEAWFCQFVTPTTSMRVCPSLLSCPSKLILVTHELLGCLPPSFGGAWVEARVS